MLWVTNALQNHQANRQIADHFRQKAQQGLSVMNRHDYDLHGALDGIQKFPTFAKKTTDAQVYSVQVEVCLTASSLSFQ